MRIDERQKLDVMEMKCLRCVREVTRMDRWRTEEVRRKGGVTKNMSERVFRKNLKLFGRLNRVIEEQLT